MGTKVTRKEELSNEVTTVRGFLISRTGACLIAGIRLAREKQVVVPTRVAVEESIEMAHEIFNKVFRKVPEQLDGRGG